MGSRRLSAHPHPPAGTAKIATVLANDGVITAFATKLSPHQARLVALPWRFQNAHVAQRVAVLVEHAEHHVAVDQQSRDVGDRGGPVLLTALARNSLL